jgi:hypothetical protein
LEKFFSNLPTIAYVVADVEETHHKDAKLRKNPRNPATQFMNMNSFVIIKGFISAWSSPLKMQNGNNRIAEIKLL